MDILSLLSVYKNRIPPHPRSFSNFRNSVLPAGVVIGKALHAPLIRACSNSLRMVVSVSSVTVSRSKRYGGGTGN